jgi:hypothetical protein
VMASTSGRYSHGKSCGADIVRHLEYPHHVVVTERQLKTVDLASQRRPISAPPPAGFQDV